MGLEQGEHVGPSTRPCYVQAHSIAERQAHPAQSTSSDWAVVNYLHPGSTHAGGRRGSRAFQQSHQLLLWSFHSHGCWAGAHTWGQRMEGNTSSIPILGALRLATGSETTHTACLQSLGQPEALSDETAPGGTNLQSWATLSA